MNNLLTMDEAAKYLGISKLTLYGWVSARKLAVRQNRAAGEVQAGSAGRLDRSAHGHTTERQPWDSPSGAIATMSSSA
ncbi:MAG: hypothetical protein CV089_04120 [Nitrospira sp. WS110]|nr:hypothetical protein [Nitrospira sp. WS110]